jgi:hypothetical protein
MYLVSDRLFAWGGQTRQRATLRLPREHLVSDGSFKHGFGTLIPLSMHRESPRKHKAPLIDCHQQSIIAQHATKLDAC